MAAEVAIQQLKGIKDKLASEHESLDELLAVALLPKIDWQDTAQRLDWDDYTRILDLVRNKRSDEWLIQRGTDSIYDTEAALFRSGLVLGFEEPGAALQWMCSALGPFSAVTPFLLNDLQQNGQRSFVLNSILQGGLIPCRGHHLFAQGVLQGFPVVLCESPANVTVSWRPEGATYKIEFEPPTLLGWARRRWRRSQPQPDYLAGIGETYLSLVERQIDLQAQQELVSKAETAALRAGKQESLGALASGVAHDFRNLLTVAQGQLELILAEANVSHRDLIGQVLATCQQGSKLTDRLLAYVRETPASPEDTNVQDVLAAVLPMLEQGLAGKGELHITVPPGPQKIHVEQGQLENALLNLVVNARDAMTDSGSVTITSEEASVSADSQLATECTPGEYVKISVEDTGIGIDPTMTDFVFDPYFTTKSGGTGLGLSSVWGFVKQNGGHVTVSPNIDRGSRFEMYLPKH